MLWSIIVGGFIGFLAGAITNKGGAMGIIANVVAGLIGSSVGQCRNVLNSICIGCSHCCCCSLIFLRKKRIALYL